LKTILLLASLCLFTVPSAVRAADLPQLLLADGKSWPGKILTVDHGQTLATRHLRGPQLAEEAIPRVQSLTVLPSGRIMFCSGLDRMVYELTGAGERQLHHGGYLARQVRGDRDGTVYWSGLETPIDNNPLPDGFIYSFNPATNEFRTVMTFSQGDVGHDWWGAFDVRDGRIFVGTFHGPSRIYDVSASPVQLLYTLPIGASAFRLMDDGSLWSCDGHGKLYRFPDPRNPGQHELLLDSETEFVDFAPAAGGK
jgi:hypothetical protein